MSTADAPQTGDGGAAAAEAVEAFEAFEAFESKSAELDAIRRRVVNVIGHELRTPVTTLHGLAEQACAATDLASVTDEIGPALLRGATRLTRLLDDLLVAAGIETAIPVEQPVLLDLPDLVTSIWAAHSPDPLMMSAEPVTVALPQTAVERTVEAVLANAAAYSTAPPSATISRSGAVVLVVVRSPGPPLHPEEVTLAVEPFFRGERAVTLRPGLGMGLAIARQMARHTGGDVRFEATEDGTATTVELPA